MKHAGIRKPTSPSWGTALLLAALTVSTTTSFGALVAEWNFNTYDGSATTVAADSGAGTLAFGSFVGTSSASQTGTSLNASSGVDPGTALALIGEANNGKSLLLHIDGTGLGNFVISYATRRTGTGFDSQTWAYSLDDTTYTDVSSLGFSADSAFETKSVDLGAILALNNQADIHLRLTLDRASSGSGNNRFDNLQINAQAFAAVPEPAHAALLSGAILSIMIIWRTRKT